MRSIFPVTDVANSRKSNALSEDRLGVEPRWISRVLVRSQEGQLGRGEMLRPFSFGDLSLGRRLFHVHRYDPRSYGGAIPHSVGSGPPSGMAASLPRPQIRPPAPQKCYARPRVRPPPPRAGTHLRT